MFKKIYIEITNKCNLNCEFCIGNERNKKFITLDEFNQLLDKLNGYTKYLYFHVMGEPLLHPHINELINEGSKRYLPSAFQIQEAFANQRLDEVIDKEGYEKDRERIKEKLEEGGRSPVEYAYELDRFFENKKVNEKGEQK